MLRRERFGVGHVEGRATDTTVANGVEERVGVDDRAARHVDQDGLRRHRRELGVADESAGRVRERAREHDRVRYRQRVVESVRTEDGVGRPPEIGRGTDTDCLHVERREPLGDRLPDVTESDDRDGRAGELRHRHRLPLSAFLLAVGALKVPDVPEQCTDDVLAHVGRVDTGRVR